MRARCLPRQKRPDVDKQEHLPARCGVRHCSSWSMALPSVALAVLSCVSPACAQDGYFDSSFAGGGQLLVDVSAAATDKGQVLRLRGDGRLFMAGTCDHVETGIAFPAFCATQLKRDGSYDTTFGPGGVGYLRFDRFAGWPNNASLYDAIILKDGRAVLVGRPTDTGTLIAVLAADGSALDATVGGGSGFVQLISSDPLAADAAFNTDSGLSKVIEQPDGKILISGSDDGPNGNPDFSVIRLLPDLSTPDPDFGSNGRRTVTFDLGGPAGLNQDSVRAMVRQPDGKIVLGGYAALTETSLHFALARLLENGALDLTFGPAHDGRAHFAPASQSAISQLLIDGQGRIIVGGVQLDPTSTYAEWMIDRLMPDGTQDPSFNGGKTQAFNVRIGFTAGNQQVSDMILQSDGKILATGSVARSTDVLSQFWGAARVLPGGTLDPAFGIGGRSYSSFSPTSAYNDNAGSIVISGSGALIGGFSRQTSGATSDYRFGLAKLLVENIYTNTFEP